MRLVDRVGECLGERPVDDSEEVFQHAVSGKDLERDPWAHSQHFGRDVDAVDGIQPLAKFLPQSLVVEWWLRARY